MISLPDLMRAMFPQERFGPFVLGVTGGIALSAAFALGVWEARPPSRLEVAQNDGAIAADPAPASQPIVPPNAAPAERIAETSATSSSHAESAPNSSPAQENHTDDLASKPAPIMTVLSVKPDTVAAPAEPVVPETSRGSDIDPAMPERAAVTPRAKLRPGAGFVLREAIHEATPCYVLPRNPWFALERVQVQEAVGVEKPAEGPRVCAADRSLNTSLSWAKSPEEAAVQAESAHKLVFLIHVSGNFEDPGFT